MWVWFIPVAMAACAVGVFVGWLKWSPLPAQPETHCKDEVPVHQWGKWGALERVHLGSTWGYSQSRACDLCGVKQRRLVKLKRPHGNAQGPGRHVRPEHPGRRQAQGR